MFTKENAALKHNSGTSKSDIEQGYTKLDDTDDAKAFGDSIRKPENRGWGDKPAPYLPTE
jgi:hypothetical protein